MGVGDYVRNGCQFTGFGCFIALLSELLLHGPFLCSKRCTSQEALVPIGQPYDEKRDAGGKDSANKGTNRTAPYLPRQDSHEIQNASPQSIKSIPGSYKRGSFWPYEDGNRWPGKPRLRWPATPSPRQQRPDSSPAWLKHYKRTRGG